MLSRSNVWKVSRRYLSGNIWRIVMPNKTHQGLLCSSRPALVDDLLQNPGLHEFLPHRDFDVIFRGLRHGVHQQALELVPDDVSKRGS